MTPLNLLYAPMVNGQDFEFILSDFKFTMLTTRNLDVQNGLGQNLDCLTMEILWFRPWLWSEMAMATGTRNFSYGQMDILTMDNLDFGHSHAHQDHGQNFLP